MLQEEHTLITYKSCVFTIKPFSGEILYSFLFLSSSLSAFFPVSLLVSSLLSFHPLSISSLCFSLLPPSFHPLSTSSLSFLPPPRWVLARVLPARHCGWMVSTLTWGSLTWRDTCPSLAEYVFTCMFYRACNQLLCMSLSVK